MSNSESLTQFLNSEEPQTQQMASDEEHQPLFNFCVRFKDFCYSVQFGEYE